MQLKDINKDRHIGLSRIQDMTIHGEVRKNRLNYKKSTRRERKRKPKDATALLGKNFKKIKKDKDKLQELLKLLE